MRAIAFGLLLIAPSISDPALAQDLTRCRDAVPAEVSLPSNRLSAKQIGTLLVGRKLIYVRPRLTQYGFTRYTTEVRTDGSLAHSFETSGYRTGPWRKGEYFSRPGGGIEHGGRTVGVWSIRDRLFCGQFVYGDTDVCYEIYVAGGRAYAKLAAETRQGACLQGPFSVE